jgi:peptidase E
MKIIAIGGGELTEGETRAIDEFSMSLTKKSSPSVLFIPTASGDSVSYFESVSKYFLGLGASEVRPLYLLSGTTEEEVDGLLECADLVYVGGGSTQLLIDTWHKYKIGAKLKDKYERNSNFILSGLSAGANCWFEYCTTDSPEVVGHDGGLGRMKCLGLIRGLASPHHIREKVEREPFLPLALDSLSGKVERAVAMDDGAALVSLDGEEFYIQSKAGSKVRVMRIGELGKYYEDIRSIDLK